MDLKQNERIDKWLWHLRLFKTRNQAANACKSKKIFINNQSINKSSKAISIGDMIVIKYRNYQRTVEVIAFPDKRINAKLVKTYMKDHTLQEEYKKRSLINLNMFAFRERGMGRPTKKERREIENLRKIKKF